MKKIINTICILPFLISCNYKWPTTTLGFENEEHKRIYNTLSSYIDYLDKDPVAVIFYYGRYNGLDVIYYQRESRKELDAITEYTIGGYYFYYPVVKEIMVMNNETYITLRKAYGVNMINMN